MQGKSLVKEAVSGIKELVEKGSDISDEQSIAEILNSFC